MAGVRPAFLVQNHDMRSWAPAQNNTARPVSCVPPLLDPWQRRQKWTSMWVLKVAGPGDLLGPDVNPPSLFMLNGLNKLQGGTMTARLSGTRVVGSS